MVLCLHCVVFVAPPLIGAVGGGGGGGVVRCRVDSEAYESSIKALFYPHSVST